MKTIVNTDKIENFRRVIQELAQYDLLARYPDWTKKGLGLPEAQVKIRTKYTLVDVGDNGGMSGRYMIENETERIYGIKAYGVINRKHRYGTLDKPVNLIRNETHNFKGGEIDKQN